MTFFGNGEPSTFNQQMVGMMRAALPTTPEIPDWIDHFVSKCLLIASATRGNISVGGMITMIARCVLVGVCVLAQREGGPGLYDRA